MKIAYADYYNRLAKLLAETLVIVEKMAKPEAAALKSKLEDTKRRLGSEEKLHVALIGEYNAGKSSLISALTEQDVYIDADVATQTTTDFEWNGHILTDTPGIQPDDNETEHDRISREATVGVDIVLFVITNELFTPRLADHLRYILDEDKLGLAKKTAIIVNKMDREVNPDTLMINAVTDVLRNHQEVPVFLCAAGKHLEAQEVKSTLKERFLRQGRLEELVEGLDAFLDKAGKTGQLATPLQIILETLETLQSILAETEQDRMRFELARRKRKVLERLENELHGIRRACREDAYTKVAHQADFVLQDITENTTPEDLAVYFETGLKQAQPDIEWLYMDACNDIQAAFQTARDALESIGESDLAKAVLKELKYQDASTQVEFNMSRPAEGLLAPKMARVALKPLQKSLEEAAKNTQLLRNGILKVGHQLGKKFRPWEAVKASGKLAKNLKYVGKSLPFIAAGIDFYIQYKEEQSKEMLERYHASLRLAVRNAFMAQAREESKNMDVILRDNYKDILSQAFHKLEVEVGQITGARVENKALQNDITNIRHRVNNLREALYSGHDSKYAL